MCPTKLSEMKIEQNQKNPTKGTVKGKKVEWKPIIQQIRQQSIKEGVMFSVSEVHKDIVKEAVTRFRTMSVLNGFCNGLAKKNAQLDRVYIDGKFLYGVLPEHYPAAVAATEAMKKP